MGSCLALDLYARRPRLDGLTDRRYSYHKFVKHLEVDEQNEYAQPPGCPPD